MLILGISAYHADSSACLLRDGRVVAAIEEERLNRVKHWSGFPQEAIRYCLDEGKATVSDLDGIAINRDPSANFWRRLGYVVRRGPSLGWFLKKLSNTRKSTSLESEFVAAFPDSKLNSRVHKVEHHEAHLASAFCFSGFEEAVCLSVDGFGDFCSAAWGLGKGDTIRIDGRVHYPHSLGFFYSAITQFLGFPHYGDEYKVMGLAPYGEPKMLEPMRQIVRVNPDGGFELNLRYFRHHREWVHYTWENCAPEVGRLFTPELSELLGPERNPKDELTQRHKDIARSAQAMYEEAFFAQLQALHKTYGNDRLALSGGCAMNSVANGKITLKSPFREVYIPAAAGDAGGAVGAACVLWRRMTGESRFAGGQDAYWGPASDDDEIAALLSKRSAEIDRADCVVEAIADSQELCVRTARCIADGEVVGWFQGRLEWGPRALGNRSILGDPRRADMKEILNQKIKRRESFRPFAPSILHEEVGRWFEQNEAVPFMSQVFQFKKEKRAEVPAVCHVDGSGRLQTVTAESNSLYHQLITEFHRLTEVPMVLNTSFNENEPVVCRPEEALDCFLRTKMDVLVVGRYFIRRNRHDAAED